MKDPPDKFKKLIKTKQKYICNGVENDAFQDEVEFPKIKTSSSLENLKVVDIEKSTGVKKKSPNGLVRSESSASGTKKKVRSANVEKSPNREYYQLWASTSSSSKDKDLACSIDFSRNDQLAPPLPPRTMHRPLERSNALSSTFKPPVLRHNKPKRNQKPEDTFEFELIDVDEPNKSLKSTSKCCDITPSSFILSEFEENTLSTPSHKPKNSNRHIGSDNYITTILTKSPEFSNLSSPLKEQFNFNAHLTLESKESQSSISTNSGSSLECLDSEIKPSLALKPHKPLTRQLSNPLTGQNQESKSTKAQLQDTSSASSEDTNRGVAVKTSIDVPDCKTPVHSKTSEVVKPFPKAFSRVAGLSNNLPVCPPTPTHHARKPKLADPLKPPSLKSNSFSLDVQPSPEKQKTNDTLELCSTSNETTSEASSLENAEEVKNLHPLLKKLDLHTVKDPRLSLRALSDMQAHASEGKSTDSAASNSSDFAQREGSSSEGEACGGLPLPLRHITSTRLPSIPERSQRMLSLSEIPVDLDEPLPPSE